MNVTNAMTVLIKENPNLALLKLDGKPVGKLFEHILLQADEIWGELLNAPLTMDVYCDAVVAYVTWLMKNEQFKVGFGPLFEAVFGDQIDNFLFEMLLDGVEGARSTWPGIVKENEGKFSESFILGYQIGIATNAEMMVELKTGELTFGKYLENYPMFLFMKASN